MTTTAWKDLQQSCSDLRRSYALIVSGKSLGKKEKDVGDIKTYTRECSVNKDGLVVKLKQFPFQPSPTQLIVVPRPHAFTIASTLHEMWDHPTNSQMQKLFTRKFFILDEAQILKTVWEMGILQSPLPSCQVTEQGVSGLQN